MTQGDRDLIERGRTLASQSIDGNLRGPALQMADRIQALSAEVEMLRAAVEKAEKTFIWYGELHAAKPDPDKAMRNFGLAGEMRQALKGANNG